MAASTPNITITFFAKVTMMFVNMKDMALGSLLTLVTSLPTGMSFSWAWDRPSIWVKTSSRMAESIFCPTFCRTMAWMYVHRRDTRSIPT